MQAYKKIIYRTHDVGGKENKLQETMFKYRLL